MMDKRFKDGMYRGMVYSMMYCMVSNWGMSYKRGMGYKGGMNSMMSNRGMCYNRSCSMSNNRATCKGSEWNLCISISISRGKSKNCSKNKSLHVVVL